MKKYISGVLISGIFMLSGCTSNNLNYEQEINTSNAITYLNCDFELQGGDIEKNSTNVIDMGDKFILMDSSGGRFEIFSGELNITDGKFMISEPNKGLSFSKGLNEYKYIYTVYEKERNRLSTINCRNKLIKTGGKTSLYKINKPT